MLGSAMLCGLGILSGAIDTYAVRAYQGPISYTQPDGSIITLYNSGDENNHSLRDAEGNLMIKGVDGMVRKADANQIVAFRAAREQRRKKYLFSGTPFPAEGSPKGLVILVQFKDKKFSMSNPQNFYTRMLNEENFSDYNATGSARDFFVQNSKGSFTPDFDVYGPVTLSKNMSYYGQNDFYGYDMYPEQAVIEALQSLDSTVNFSQYDLDGDGQIDNVFVFYAGYGEADSAIDDTIWPHSADILEYGLATNYYFDGKLLNRYGMTNEVDYTYKRPDGIGTFVHEFSHVLGIPDFYATDYSTAYTPGEYSTMDYGPYNNEGRTPPNYSFFERMSLGWVNPSEITSTGEYTLLPMEQNNDAYIIHTEKEDEFYILENRQKSGWDAYIPGHGMLVWHIDFNQSKWDNNIVNNTASHQYVDLIEADNKKTDATRAGDPFPGSGNITSFTSTTNPALKSWSGKATDVALSQIKEAGKNISFVATVTGNSTGGDNNNNGDNDDPVNGKTVTFVAADYFSAADPNPTTWELSDDFHCEVAQNNGQTKPAYNSKGSDLRLYANNSLTLTAADGLTIQKVVFSISTQGKKRLAEITASNGSIQAQSKGDSEVIWTGSSSDIVFTVGEKAVYGSDGASKAGQFDFLSMAVTYSSSTTTIVNAVDSVDEAEVIYYNLQGHRVENPEKGIFIKVQGEKVTKIVK